MSRSILLAAAAVFAIGACSRPSEQAATTPAAPAMVKAHPLPAAIAYPEGIAFDEAAGVFYTAGATDGAVVKVDLASGASTPIAAAGVLTPAGSDIFPAVLGMKLDENKRLWLAGGRTGKLHVLDTTSGKVVKTLDTPGSGGLINDVTLTADAAYFSDSFRPVVWKVGRAGGQVGAAEAWLDIGKAVAYGEGANINGLVSTPDGKTLLLVQMNKGLLFKVDIASKAVTPVNLTGQTLQGADGLVLDGQRLYAVLQPHATIVAVNLAPDMTSGVVAGRLKSDALAWPATAFKTGDRLVVVNMQFNKREGDTASKPFSVSEIPVSLIK